MARVLLTPDGRQQLDELPAIIHLRVLRLLERLTHWANVSGAKRLGGRLSGYYRLRTGDYRVQFYPKGDVVVVTKIGHRDGFYDE